MIYDFICEKNHHTEIKMSMKENIPGYIECSDCGEKAYRNWGDSAIHIPDYMRSTGDANKDTGTNLSYLKKCMKKRPSGREKIYW